MQCTATIWTIIWKGVLPWFSQFCHDLNIMVQLLFIECGTLFLVRGKSTFALLIPCRSAYWILKFIYTESSVTLEPFSQYRELLCSPIWLPYFWGVFLSLCIYIHTHTCICIYVLLPSPSLNMCTIKSLCHTAKAFLLPTQMQRTFCCSLCTSYSAALLLCPCSAI